MANQVDIPKETLAQILTKLRAQNANKTCFDCGSKNPSWASVTYGIFICIDCSAVHRSLGVHLSFVRSTLLDTCWNLSQLRAMQLGGNANAVSFFKQHNCNIQDQNQKYNSRVAQLYRDKLAGLINNSFKVYGNSIELPSHNSSVTSSETTNEKTETDFWEDVSKSASALSEKPDTKLNVPKTSSVKNANAPKNGPNVNLSSDSNPVSSYKPSLIGKKQINNKKGLGAKKGFGAQKVQTNFEKIEQEALDAEQFKLNNPPKVLSSEEQEDALTSINLAYQDLSDKQKKTEDKLKSVDPNKAQQFERLGMGFGSYGGNARSSHISHSAVTDMKLIEQSNPVVSSNQNSRDLAGDPFSANKYKDFVKQSDDDFWNDNGVFSKKPSKKPDTIDSIATIDLDRNHSKRTGSNSGGIKPNTGSSNTQVAQQKFSNAKSISSDQYFNKDVSNSDDNQSSRRFEGSRGISSDDYFNRSPSVPANNASYGSNFNSGNLYDIKENVKDSVTKIAGMLSEMTTDLVKNMNRT